jgi:hypothetical protein
VSVPIVSVAGCRAFAFAYTTDGDQAGSRRLLIVPCAPRSTFSRRLEGPALALPTSTLDGMGAARDDQLSGLDPLSAGCAGGERAKLGAAAVFRDDWHVVAVDVFVAPLFERLRRATSSALGCASSTRERVRAPTSLRVPLDRDGQRAAPDRARPSRRWPHSLGRLEEIGVVERRMD